MNFAGDENTVPKVVVDGVKAQVDTIRHGLGFGEGEQNLGRVGFVLAPNQLSA
jgi:hypothetical protein